MRFHKDGKITCQSSDMVSALNLLTNSKNRFDHLVTQPGAEMQEHDCFMFRSGAKLNRVSENKWYIRGYRSDHRDIRAAMHELRAADHVRQAVSLLESVDVVLVTPMQYRIGHIGLWGKYPDGINSPSECRTDQN